MKNLSLISLFSVQDRFFSGMAPWISGHYHNVPGVNLSEPLQDALSLAGCFKRAGYYTAGYGKITYGWDQREHWDEKIGHKRDPAPSGAPLTSVGRGEQVWGPIHLAEDAHNLGLYYRVLNQQQKDAKNSIWRQRIQG